MFANSIRRREDIEVDIQQVPGGDRITWSSVNDVVVRVVVSFTATPSRGQAFYGIRK